MTSSSNRHHPYHTPGHRLHHNSTGSSGSSVAELNEITEVINEDLSTGNMNDHQAHHYTNMDNMDVDIQTQMKMESNGMSNSCFQAAISLSSRFCSICIFRIVDYSTFLPRNQGALIIATPTKVHQSKIGACIISH